MISLSVTICSVLVDLIEIGHKDDYQRQSLPPNAGLYNKLHKTIEIKDFW